MVTIDSGRTETVETRSNLVPNPAMRTGFTGSWSTTTGGGAVVTLDRLTGQTLPIGEEFTAYARVTLTTSGSWWRLVGGSYVPVIAGATYTVSVWVNGNAGLVYPRIRWRGSDGVTIAEGGVATTIPDSEWVRVSYTAIAPEGAVGARVEFERRDQIVGSVARYVGVLFERADTARPYFDGATIDEPPVEYAWTGTANNSPSVELTTRAVDITPELMDGYAAAREVRNVVHEIVGRSNPDITLRAPGLRAGEFKCLFANQADAVRAYGILSVPQVFTVNDPDLPGVDMSFVLRPGELRIELDTETRIAWWLYVPFQEVAP